jgi:hypothetical protein
MLVSDQHITVQIHLFRCIFGLFPPPSFLCPDGWDPKLLYSQLAVLCGLRIYRGCRYVQASGLASIDGPFEGRLDRSRLLGKVLASEPQAGKFLCLLEHLFLTSNRSLPYLSKSSPTTSQFDMEHCYRDTRSYTWPSSPHL